MTRNGTEAPAIQHTFDTVNSAYEKWLRSECDVVTEDLKKKHKRMRKSAFDFLRATYFRWAESIESLCPDLRDAPVVLSVGDMHVENFGTWRDGDGRLVWGINDFDEAAAMPYVWDLVRLAVSADLAPPRRLTAARATQALLSGYRDGLSAPRPAVLDQDNRWIRRYVEGSARADEEFWAGIDACRSGAPPQSVQRALRRILPAHTEVVRFAARTAGGGSLGRARYVVVGQWQGALIVREAKALVPSAWQWVHGSEPAVIRFQEISNGP